MFLLSVLVLDTTGKQGTVITALIIVIQLIIGFDFSVNIYSAVFYAQWYHVLLPKSELQERFIQHLCAPRLLSLINSTMNNSPIFRANQKNQRKKNNLYRQCF